MLAWCSLEINEQHVLTNNFTTNCHFLSRAFFFFFDLPEMSSFDKKDYCLHWLRGRLCGTEGSSVFFQVNVKACVHRKVEIHLE